jgi:hypothetical protein
MSVVKQNVDNEQNHDLSEDNATEKASCGFYIAPESDLQVFQVLILITA